MRAAGLDGQVSQQGARFVIEDILRRLPVEADFHWAKQKNFEAVWGDCHDSVSIIFYTRK